MTQVNKLIKEINYRSKYKSGRHSFISIREIEVNLKINSAYVVMQKVKAKIKLLELDDINLITGTRFKIWRLK